MKDNPENLLIIADMEGTMGLVDMQLQNGSSEEWAGYGRKLLTREINAAAAGGLAGGAKRVFLCDAHDSGKNTDDKYLMAMIAKLPPHSCNSNLHTREVTEAIYRENRIGAVALVGYHPMASCRKGFAPHSVDARRNRKIQINASEVGEIAMISALAGYFNIPVVAVTGDREAVREARAIHPKIQGVATKRRLKDGSVVLKELGACEVGILQAVRKGFVRRRNMKPFVFSSPVKFSYDLHPVEHLERLELPPGVLRQKRRLTWQDEDYLAAWDVFWTLYFRMMFLDIPA